MKFYDFWAESFHWRAGERKWLSALLCRCGLHWWGYTGEINCWPAGERHLWSCCRCPAERWLRTMFE